MNFVELKFLAFFAVFTAAFFATRGRARLWVSLGGSYFFYGSWDWRFLGLIFFSSFLDFHVAKRIVAAPNPRARRALLTLSLVCNLSVLFVFKYLQFFIDSTIVLLKAVGLSPNPLTLGLILPVGISFYTFQTVSYVMDVYRKRMESAPSLLHYLVFVAFFPQLVAGPIVRAKTFLPQLSIDHLFEWRRTRMALQMIFWGYFLKVAMADSIAPFVTSCFDWPEVSGSITLALGAFLFSFQLYGDFAGYSLIAIGLGKIYGFDFGKNFAHPFFATSFSDFWSRWHVSLSTWLRDYLFVPLGGFARTQVRVHVALLLTFFLAGLWHGANWNFVIFGMIHGVMLSAQRLMAPLLGAVARAGGKVGGLCLSGLGMLLVFGVTTISFVFFRSQNLEQAMKYLEHLFALDSLSPASIRYKLIAVKSLLLVAIVLVVELLAIRKKSFDYFETRPIQQAVALALCGVGIALLGTFAGKNFIYFQF